MNVSGPPGFAMPTCLMRKEQIIGGIMEETHNRLLKEPCTALTTLTLE